jgi:hypothetical protein
MFENMALRKLPGPEMEEVTGGWREAHNDELYKLYSSPKKSNDLIRT